MGSQVAELEQQLADYVGVKHCISCGNGTDALSMALMALNIGPGDAVFVPDFTFFATAEAVAMVGATPVFVDVNKDTFNIDVDDLIKKYYALIEQGYLLLHGAVKLLALHIGKQTSPAYHAHLSVTATTEQAGSVSFSLPPSTLAS
jgi:DNA-binding transcriptional MocR family regulator